MLTGRVQQKVAIQLQHTNALLDKYVRILSTSEKVAKLVLDERWEGADAVSGSIRCTFLLKFTKCQDEEIVERELEEERERELREEEVRIAAERERERLEREEQERREQRELRERLEQEKAQAVAASGRGSGVRGVRGTRASMRGMTRAGALFSSIGYFLMNAHSLQRLQQRVQELLEELHLAVQRSEALAGLVE